MRTTWIFRSQQLKSLRELSGLSPSAFGKRIGRSSFSVLSWEKGTTYPTARDLVKIAEAFDTNPHAFFKKNGMP